MRSERVADATAKRFGTRKRKLFGVLASCLVVFVPLVEGEIGARLFLSYNTPDTLRSYSLQFSPCILRIAVLGGSAVFDPTASEGNDWPHLVERFLKNRGYPNVEVINAGVPGHATFDALGRLYSQIWLDEPDYVLLYNAWNDIKYFRALTPERPLMSLFKPDDENADPFQTYQGTWDYLFSTSQLYMKARNRYLAWKYNIGREGTIPEVEYTSTYSSYGVRQYRLNVQLIVDACRNIGAVPLLLTQATLVSARNSADERKLVEHRYVGLSHDALVGAFDEVDQVVRWVAREKGVMFLDLVEMFSGRRELFTDAVHTTRRGSEEIAKAVGRFIAERLSGEL